MSRPEEARAEKALEESIMGMMKRKRGSRSRWG